MSLSLRLAAAAFAAVAAFGASAQANWRDTVNVLRVGVLGSEEAPYRIATLEPFRVYLQDKTGVPVEIVPVASYDMLIAGQSAGDIDYAIYSATAFATALVKCECVEALAAPLATDGALGFHSVLLARRGDDIAGLAGAEGKRIGLGPEGSVAASLMPRHALAAADIDPATFFASVTEYAAPEEAVAALVAGEIDLAAAWSSMTGSSASGYTFGTLHRMVEDGDLTMDQVRIVWQSPLIPFGPHAIRLGLPPELKASLSGAILSMAENDPEALDAVDRLGFGGGGFTSPDQSLYASVVALVTPPKAE